MADEDYERELGVVEAFTVITQQCPSGVVRTCAEQALEAVKSGGSAVLREQAWYVLSTLQGWRGERASQVHRSLSAFLERTDPEAGSNAT